MAYNMHVQKHSILTIYSDLSLSLSLWRTTCMYRNTQHWQYIRASLSLSRYDLQHACTDTLDTDNIFGPLSLYLFRNDVQHACTETLDTDNIFGPLSVSLVMTYNMHVQKHSILTIYSGLSLSLSLWRTTCMYRDTRYWQYIRASLSPNDVQHACTETLDTDNILGPLSLSLSLWRTTWMYRNSRYWQYIRASLSLSRYDVQHACTETLDTDNIFEPLSLSLSLLRTTCMYRNTRYCQ